MSKSYGNAIGLSEDPESVRAKVQRMLTDVLRPRREDPGHPENCPVFTYHQVFSSPQRIAEVDRDCRAAVLGCGDDKKAMAEIIIAWQAPFRKRRQELEKDPGYIEKVIRDGNRRAREIAAQTMSEVREAIGFWPPRGAVIG